MGATIDLNADVGEECGDDAALFGIISTANVAAGGHAGGGAALAEAVRLAAASGVAVGAHPSYADRPAFGRLSPAGSPDELGIAAEVCAQVRAVMAACERVGIGVSHVKAHGALYNDATVTDAAARAVVAGVVQASELGGRAILPVMGQPRSALDGACAAASVPYIAEGFGDRAYLTDGRLVPRTVPGSVLDDVDRVCAQVLQLATTGTVTAIDGTVVPMKVSTVCLHGDTPGAVRLARAVRTALEANGVVIRAPGRRG